MHDVRVRHASQCVREGSVRYFAHFVTYRSLSTRKVQRHKDRGGADSVLGRSDAVNTSSLIGTHRGDGVGTSTHVLARRASLQAQWEDSIACMCMYDRVQLTQGGLRGVLRTRISPLSWGQAESDGEITNPCKALTLVRIVSSSVGRGEVGASAPAMVNLWLRKGSCVCGCH